MALHASPVPHRVVVRRQASHGVVAPRRRSGPRACLTAPIPGRLPDAPPPHRHAGGACPAAAEARQPRRPSPPQTPPHHVVWSLVRVFRAAPHGALPHQTLGQPRPPDPRPPRRQHRRLPPSSLALRQPPRAAGRAPLHEPPARVPSLGGPHHHRVGAPSGQARRQALAGCCMGFLSWSVATGPSKGRSGCISACAPSSCPPTPPPPPSRPAQAGHPRLI